VLNFEFPFQNFPGERRVCLALAQFHHLALEEIQRDETQSRKTEGA
jgi:hypothetical protein